MSAEEAAAEAQEWGPGAVWVTGFAADALEELRCAVCLGYLDLTLPQAVPQTLPPNPKLNPKPYPRLRLNPKP